MKLRHLGVFLCVCDEGNMTAAAEKLHMTQPSVSQAIAELENFYRVKLFERLGRKLFLTVAGQTLLTYARHIINLSREAEESMREIHRKGILRIGASTTIGASILSELLAVFVGEHPQVKLQTVVNNTKEIEELLLLDQLDIGLVEGSVVSPAVLAEPFMQEEMILVCGTEHPLAKKQSIKPIDLDGLEFVVREAGSGTRELFESVMNSQGLRWQTYGVYNNTEAIKKTVAAGLALSVMSGLLVRREIDEGALVVIAIENIRFQRQFSIAHHKNKFLQPMVQHFIQLCLQYGK